MNISALSCNQSVSPTTYPINADTDYWSCCYPLQGEPETKPLTNIAFSPASNSMWTVSLASTKDLDNRRRLTAIEAQRSIQSDIRFCSIDHSNALVAKKWRPTVWASGICSPCAAGSNNCLYAFCCIPCAIADLSSAHRGELLSSTDDWINWCCCVTPSALRHSVRTERDIREFHSGPALILENFFDCISCCPFFTGFALVQMIVQIETVTKLPLRKFNFRNRCCGNIDASRQTLPSTVGKQTGAEVLDGF